MKLPSAEDFFVFDINKSEFLEDYRRITTGGKNAVNAYTRLCSHLLLKDKSFSDFVHDTLI